MSELPDGSFDKIETKYRVGEMVTARILKVGIFVMLGHYFSILLKLYCPAYQVCFSICSLAITLFVIYI